VIFFIFDTFYALRKFMIEYVRRCA